MKYFLTHFHSATKYIFKLFLRNRSMVSLPHLRSTRCSFQNWRCHVEMWDLNNCQKKMQSGSVFPAHTFSIAVEFQQMYKGGGGTLISMTFSIVLEDLIYPWEHSLFSEAGAINWGCIQGQMLLLLMAFSSPFLKTKLAYTGVCSGNIQRLLFPSGKQIWPNMIWHNCPPQLK